MVLFIFCASTYDDAHFTALVVKSTGHHGANCVIYHRHDVCLVVLNEIRSK